MNKKFFKIILAVVFIIFIISFISFFLQKRAIKKEKENNLCVDFCGDGICQDLVCFGTECPCPESSKSCLVDCIDEK